MNCSVGHRLHTVRSVLSLALADDRVFAGLQGGDVLSWSLHSFALINAVHAHEESVLSLCLANDRLLLSSGGDSVVNVWSTSLELLYSIDSHHDVGDLFAVAYSASLQTVYTGGQNTSLQWCSLASERTNRTRRAHRFFDSEPPSDGSEGDDDDNDPGSCQYLSFRRDHHRLFAHHGYIYSMLLGQDEAHAGQELLYTGSGDGTVKIWSLDNDTTPYETAELDNGGDSVLSIVVDGPFLYCGLASAVNIWNLDSRQVIKRLDLNGDVWAIGILGGLILTGDSDGVLRKFDSRFEQIASWSAHNGTMLAAAARTISDRRILATGGNDDTVIVWDLTGRSVEKGDRPAISNDEMVTALQQLVALKTISSRPSFSADCNQAAVFLRRHCSYLGAAQTRLLPTGPESNPIVYARFEANTLTDSPPKTILFYGHYDVVPADMDEYPKWSTDPFHLTSLDGYLYGRGVSDNKGPLLAALYAVAELVQVRALSCNIVFLIEGEEESGSHGFINAVAAHTDLIGPVDFVLLANSYWLDDRIPCLTYGLRGVVHAALTVRSGRPDLHSGIDGSALLDEPLKDLSMLLASLVGPHGQINLPGFHDAVQPLTTAERERYSAIANALALAEDDGDGGANSHGQQVIAQSSAEDLTASLMHRWREPSLTIHTITTPTLPPSSATTIPRAATALLSIRIVPDQDSSAVAMLLTDTVRARFAELGSVNGLNVEVTGTAEPWLGEPGNAIFRALEEAVEAVWGAPLQEIAGIGEAINVVQGGGGGGGGGGDSTAAHHSHSNTNTISTHHRTCPTKTTTSTATASPHPKTTTTKPLYIREGGSIPTVRPLEKLLRAPAAHLPCGQASDHAHLDNERMRVENLYRSRAILGRVFGGRVGKKRDT